MSTTNVTWTLSSDIELEEIDSFLPNINMIINTIISVVVVTSCTNLIW